MNTQFFDRKPVVSVVVVVYNMAREAPRTLYSLSAAYQRDIAADDYEIIVVDNGSSPAFDPSIIDALDGHFRLIRLYPAPKSPAHALNVGIAAARGDIIGVMVDGARMVTPGLLHFARAGVGLYPRAVVATLGWYLGLDHQRWSVEGGYNKDREDQLLESVNWREDGYRLFDISAPDETTIDGWFGAMCESNALFLSRASWDLLGGVDERFDYPGGGFLNLDLIIQAYELPQARLVILLGEGTFHQLHGGIATNAKHSAIVESVALWREQFETLRGRSWAPPYMPERTYVGALPRPALKQFARSLIEPVAALPFGETFDRSMWTLAPAPMPEDPVIAQLVELAQEEFRMRRFPAACVVARLIRELAPDEPAPQALLASACAWLPGSAEPEGLGPIRRAEYFHAMAKAFAILGKREDALAAYEAVMRVNDNLPLVYLEMSRLRMPGDHFLNWLGRIHDALAPATYLEIGVEEGSSLSQARAPTLAIGIDPVPDPKFRLSAETHIFTDYSDDFFAKARLETTWPGRLIDFAFIDGAHVFAQSLRDFINVEARSNPDGLIAIHDTIPFNELTQRPERQRDFYSGDTWKLIVCLRHYRPDLKIVTIPASPTGLTLVGNLAPRSRVLQDHLDEAIVLFENYDFDAFQAHKTHILNIVANDWSSFEAHFGRSAIAAE